MSIEQERLRKLGLGETETKKNVKAMDEATIIDRISMLNEMPIEQFNKLLLQKPNTVIDKDITVKKEVRVCSKAENCYIVDIEFNLLFNYKIAGYRFDGSLYTINNVNNVRNMSYSLSEKAIQRKGGVFHLKVNYTHHTTFCGLSILSSVIKRTTHSLSIPNWELMSAHGFSGEQILKILEKLNKAREEEITLENWNELNERFEIEECRNEHSDDYHSYSDCEDTDYCDYSHYDNEEDYCSQNCDTSIQNELVLFLSQPHFFSDMTNFCTGSQFNSNKTFIELQKYPNPITYIAEMIRVANDVNYDDSYNKDKYFSDVFENFEIFNLRDSAFQRLKQLSDHYDNRRNSSEYCLKSSKIHQISPNCYCIQCMMFRVYLKDGLKYDPSKLLFGDIVEVDKKKFFNVLKYYNGEGHWEDFDGSQENRVKDIAKVNMSDDKYHFSTSQFNTLNSGQFNRHFFLGLMKHIGLDKIEIVNLSYTKDRYDKYTQFRERISQFSNLSLNDFPKDMIDNLNEELPKMKEIASKVEKLSFSEYLFRMYEKIAI